MFFADSIGSNYIENFQLPHVARFKSIQVQNNCNSFVLSSQIITMGIMPWVSFEFMLGFPRIGYVSTVTLTTIKGKMN